MSPLSVLRSLGNERVLTGNEIFEAILQASKITISDRYEDADALEIAVRLLDASEKGQVPYGSHQAIEHLAEECGLFPYVNSRSIDIRRAAAMEAFAVQLDTKIYLHAKQMEVLSRLSNGENVVLSAPTSFGKSLIVDAYIQSNQPATVLIIVPTIALIDETRRRIEKNFGRQYQTISRQSDIRKNDYAVYVLTQERYLNRDDVRDIDLLFLDEFYKLDPSRQDSRFQTLNVALYKALKVAKQFFLAGPNIAFLSTGPAWSERIVFMRSHYQTVTMNSIDRSKAEQKFQCFLQDLNGAQGKQSLIYTKSPPSSRRLVEELLAAGYKTESDYGQILYDWLAANYHPEWILATSCAAGIGMHNGKIPRAVSQLLVDLFNDGELPVLICTSTLIEGVNTSAENVFVYDKEISTKPFDFFSFANIRGRVGRMMQHFVGNVYLYHTPPSETDMTVDVPVLSDLNNVDDFILLNLDSRELGPAGISRQLGLPLVFDVSAETLKKYGHFSGEALGEVKRHLKEALLRKSHHYIWSGQPNYNQKIALAAAIRPLLKAKVDKSTRLSEKQMAWAWGKLGRNAPISEFLTWFQSVFSDDDTQGGIDRAFEFLSSCEFNQATAVGAVNALVREISQAAAVDYSFFIVELETWFRPAWMKELDEVGIPVPLSERLLPHLGRPEHYRDALISISELPPMILAELSIIDRMMIKRATDLIH